jgi:hypothetical protein
MARKRSVVGMVAIVVGSVLGAALLFVAASIVFFVIGRRADFADQGRRVESLERGPAAAPAVSAGGSRAESAVSSRTTPSLAADLAIPGDLPLDRLRMIATHNSYRRRADPLRLFFIGLAQPGEPARLGYGHPPLTDQLDSGVRSFELDVRLRGEQFQTAHVPLVDNRSTVPDLGLALREIALWSERNPGHVPIILLLELKDDYMFLDPGLRRIDAGALDSLDSLIRRELADRLITPDDVRGGAPSLSAAIQLRGWPAVGALRGRVLVVLHQNEAYRQLYLKGPPLLEGRAMFTCAPPGAPDAGIVIANNPMNDSARIADLVARGFLVRTRADADGIHSERDLAAARASGAQIVSTDFPPLYPAADGYRGAFADGRMLEVRP